jgi:RIO-like serine/threonine protein kinase
MKNTIKKNNYIIKTYSKYNPIRLCNGLTKNQAIALESQCLSRLNSEHFPKLIESNGDCLIMSYQGVSLDKLRKNTIIPNPKKQIREIIKQLEENNIVHLDMHSSGKNLCVDKNGTLSIIDFDMAVIDDTVMSNTLQHFYDIYLNNGKKKFFARKIKYILENNNYIFFENN